MEAAAERMRKLGFSDEDLQLGLEEKPYKSGDSELSSLSKLAELQSALKSPKQSPLKKRSEQDISAFTKNITISQNIQSRNELFASFRNPSCWNR